MPVPVMFLVLFSAGLHATWNGMVKAGTDRYLDTAGITLGAGIIATVALPFLRHPAFACWPYIVVSAVIHVAYFTLIAESYHRGEMSVVYPVMRGTAPVLAAIGSAIALHERPSAAGWAGACLVSLGVVTFAFDKRNRAAIHLRPIALALLNAVIIALYTLVDGMGVRISGQAVSYTCLDTLICTLVFVPLVTILRRKESAEHFRSSWKRGLVAGGCSLAAYTLALWAMTRASIASVAALREVAILFGFLIAVFTLKERVSPVRVFACLLVVAGAIAIKLQ